MCVAVDLCYRLTILENDSVVMWEKRGEGYGVS